MSGLRNIAKMYGGIIINGLRYVWDYKQDKPVREDEMIRDRRGQVGREKRQRLQSKQVAG